MLNVSEELPIEERIQVLDRVAQKLTNSGYNKNEIRKGMVGALTGYERRLAASKKSKGENGYKPLHEGAEVNHGARIKLTGKSSWFKEKSSYNEEESGPGTNKNDEQEQAKKRKRRGEENERPRKDVKKAKIMGKQMKTTSVMFVESTPHGMLCSNLQKGEDRMAEVVNRRVKMVEMGGTQLGQLFSNTDPWSGAACEREDCYTCHQGGQDRKEDCFKRNILYESRCEICLKEQERSEEEDKEARVMQGAAEKRKARGGTDFTEKGVYVGESSRSLYERTKEHLADAVKDAPDSHMRKHWREAHPDEEEMPKFRFRIVKTFKDCLSRQVPESVRIDLRGSFINSKTVYSRNQLPRLEVEKPEWERAEEDRRRKLKEWEEKKSWERECERSREEAIENEGTEGEDMMRENWRLNRVQRIKDDEQEEENPRKKRRRGQYGGRVDWGVTELSEDEVQRGKWLVEDEGRIDQKGMLKQSTLKPWSKVKTYDKRINTVLSR